MNEPNSNWNNFLIPVELDRHEQHFNYDHEYNYCGENIRSLSKPSDYKFTLVGQKRFMDVKVTATIELEVDGYKRSSSMYKLPTSFKERLENNTALLRILWPVNVV